MQRYLTYLASGQTGWPIEPRSSAVAGFLAAWRLPLASVVRLQEETVKKVGTFMKILEH